MGQQTLHILSGSLLKWGQSLGKKGLVVQGTYITQYNGCGEAPAPRLLWTRRQARPIKECMYRQRCDWVTRIITARQLTSVTSSSVAGN
jgi:hypothetical protein